MNIDTNEIIEKKQYIARIIDGRAESVFSHSKDTAYIAERLAPEYLKSTGRLTAVLHDSGKNCDDFLEYIIKRTNDPSSVKKGSVIHSTAGAMIADSLSGTDKAGLFTAEIIRHAIISHHGINDCVTPEGEIKYSQRCEKQHGIDKIRREVYGYISEEELTELFQQSVTEIKDIVRKIADLTSDKQLGTKSFYCGMLERVLLSILIDADRSASACFAKNVEPKPYETPEKEFWADLIMTIEDFLSTKISDNLIGQIRQEISFACKVAGESSDNMLRLVVPTGAGKTLSSLRYSLYQAKKFGKKHIIYVAPFNSILEQNAMEFRKALGNPGIEIVLEHHSNLIPDDAEEYEALTQNWSAPIVLTSAVQFLNALFSSRSGAIRRMHALTDSVIIVDEVQSIPIRCIALFNMAMNFLAVICGSAVVLCSATQPPFDELQNHRLISPADMLPDAECYQSAYRRTRILDKTSLVPGGMDVRTAAQFASELLKTDSSILFIVNTKKCAKDLYMELKELYSNSCDAPLILHLSTNMCPKHRRNVLERIRVTLDRIRATDEERPMICISTQLIEAGVDVSFETVIRSAAGLHNIIQSAGRANRNAETACGNVFVVKLAAELEDLSRLAEIRDAQNAYYSVLANKKGFELDSSEAMDMYYRYYLSGKEQMLCYPGPISGVSLVELLSGNLIGQNNLKRSGVKVPMLTQAFKTAGDHFQVIEEKDMIDILVEYDEQSAVLIKRLNSNTNWQELEALLPQLQPYTVSISQAMLRNLGEATYTVANGAVTILLKQYYHPETGVTDAPSQMEFFMA